MNSIDNQKSNKNYIISEEKKFCENEMLKMLLEKIEKLENEIKELKSNNNNTNNTLINNIDKPLNELKSEEKVDENTNNIVLIGSRHEKFNEKYLNELALHGKLIDIQNYICSYYAKVIGLKNTVLYFNKYKNKFDKESYNDFNRNILKPITKLYSEYHKKFDFTEWFDSTLNPKYDIVCDIFRPKVFTEDDNRYINLAGTHLHLHKEFKPLNSYPKDIQIKVQFIWNHLKKMWCSNKEDQFKYVQNWIANIVVGNKMRTCIYLQSPQGIGKSIITEFLSNYVIGDELSFTYSEVSSFIRFNSPLMGRLLIVFEEVPAADQYEWKLFGDRLNQCLTGNTIDIEKKHIDKIKVRNTVSFIIHTNNYTALKLSPNDRRFFMPDIVNKKESKEYYKMLYQYTNDPIVGEAFYMHCKEIVNNNPNFDDYDRPITKKFRDNIVDGVPPTYKFIRETYIMNYLGIDMKFKDLYTDYIGFCANHSMKALNKHAFKDELINIGINYIPNSTRYCHHHQNWVENTHKQLVEIFLKNNLMTKEDLGDMEYIPENNENGDNNGNKINDYLFQEKNETQKENEKQEEVKEQENKKIEDNNEDKDNEEEIEIPAAKKIRKKEILTKDEAINKIKLKKREFKIKFNNSD